MAFLGSRFTFGSSRGLFHSSGMADGNSVTGVGTDQTFQQRQKVDKSRQTIAQYRDAAVVQTYRKEAVVSSKLVSDDKDNAEEKRKRRKKRTSQIDTSERPTSRVKRVRTSRIDIVKPSYRDQATHEAQMAHELNGARAAPVSRRMTFCEPTSRKYNPYQ